MKTRPLEDGSSDYADAPRTVQLAAELLADPTAARRARRLRVGVFSLLEEALLVVNADNEVRTLSPKP